MNSPPDPYFPCFFPASARFASPSPERRRLRRGRSRRSTLEPDYRVEIALLIDSRRLFGVHALAQVDLGIRRHRNRPLEELRPMAVDVLRAALERYKVDLPSTRVSYFGAELLPRMTMTSSPDAPATGVRCPNG